MTKDIEYEINKVEGVEFIFIRRYSAYVTRGKIFKWKDVEPRILRVLKKYDKEGMNGR